MDPVKASFLISIIERQQPPVTLSISAISSMPATLVITIQILIFLPDCMLQEGRDGVWLIPCCIPSS